MRMWGLVCLFDLFFVIDECTKPVDETKLIHDAALFPRVLDAVHFIIPDPGVLRVGKN